MGSRETGETVRSNARMARFPSPPKLTNYQVNLNQFQASGAPGRVPEAMEKGNCSWEGRGKKNPTMFSAHSTHVPFKAACPGHGEAMNTFAIDPACPSLKPYLTGQMLHPSTGFPELCFYYNNKSTQGLLQDNTDRTNIYKFCSPRESQRMAGRVGGRSRVFCKDRLWQPGSRAPRGLQLSSRRS